MTRRIRKLDTYVHAHLELPPVTVTAHLITLERHADHLLHLAMRKLIGAGDYCAGLRRPVDSRTPADSVPGHAERMARADAARVQLQQLLRARQDLAAVVAALENAVARDAAATPMELRDRAFTELLPQWERWQYAYPIEEPSRIYRW